MQAMQYFNYGEFDLALEKIDEALKKDKKYIDALLLKGEILEKKKQYAEAMACYRQVLDLNSRLTNTYLFMAEMQFAAGWYDSAIFNINAYIETKPKEESLRKANFLLANATFAAGAVKTPVPFEPMNMGTNVNTAESEYFPGITADGEFFIFTRRLDGDIPHEDFFICRKQSDGSWGLAYNLGPPVNTPENEGSVSISTDGQFIFFTACDRPKRYTLQGRENGAAPREVFGGCDLYFSRLEGDKWSIPRHLGEIVNSPQWESTPSLAFDGLTLYFSSTRPGGLGGSDIWKSQFGPKGFSEPVNMGPAVNTPYNEQTPFIHPDNQTLYFSSNGRPGMGGFDFYYSRVDENGIWQEAVNLGYPINTFGDEKGLLVDRSGEVAYFSSHDRQDTKGGVDIYQFALYPGARPKVLSYVKAIVVDDETGQPLSASAELLSLETGATVISTSTNAKTGSFLIVLQANSNYALNVNKEGYLFHSENFALTESAEATPYTITVRLKKLKADQNVVLKNVFFDVNSYELKPESKVELNKLVEFMQKQSTVKIEIGGHTDNTGNPAANKVLSENRAKSVYDYLVAQGIDPKRLSFKGYGATVPIADNATEPGRKENRRTEYRIIAL